MACMLLPDRYYMALFRVTGLPFATNEPIEKGVEYIHYTTLQMHTCRKDRIMETRVYEPTPPEKGSLRLRWDKNCFRTRVSGYRHGYSSIHSDTMEAAVSFQAEVGGQAGVCAEEGNNT